METIKTNAPLRSIAVSVALVSLFLFTSTASAQTSPQIQPSPCTQAQIDSGWTNDYSTAYGSDAGSAQCLPPGTNTANTNQYGTDNGTKPVSLKNCSVISFKDGFNMDCLWLNVMSWLGSWFLTIGGAAVRLAGSLFDSLITQVIVGFKGTLETMGITGAINGGWTVFRDFSNILIIGIFVFIAISIILNLREFGDKRLIAKVLMVAILINFSLLFTKIVIDGSNFVAFQIYNQVATVSGSASGEKKDIAQAFLQPMGITNIWDTSGITKSVGEGTNSGVQAFFFGLVGGILLLAVAAVLFYGCFLIAGRAILFIFLMITAALAFATYLVPSLEKGEYGWSSWWKALINNAIFAPLLMLFLAVSISIIGAAGKQAIVSCTGSGDSLKCASNLGLTIADPATQLNTTAGWSAILIYLIGIGLLFVSLRMASKFAGTISGFNLAAMVPALGLAAGARVAAFAGRNAIGRPALRASEGLKTRAQNAADGSLAQTLYKFGSQGLKGVGKADFNPMRTPLGAGVATVTGQKLDTLIGKAVGGAEGARKLAAKRAAENAEFLHVDAKQQKDITEKAVASAIASDPVLQERHTTAQGAANTHEAEKAAAEREHASAQEANVRAESQLRRAREANDANAAREAQNQLDQSAENMRQQANRIKEATKRLNSAKEVVENVNSTAKANAISSGNLKEYKSEGEIAATLAKKRFTSAFFTDKENEKIAGLASKEVKDHHDKKQVKKITDILKEHGDDGHGHGATPAKPPAAAAKPAAHNTAPGDDHAGSHDDHGDGHHK